MNTHKERIKERIKASIQQFRNHSIDFYKLNSDIIGNLRALDNLDKSVENASINLCGELEIIYYTVDSDKIHEAMLKEINKFEPYIDKI